MRWLISVGSVVQLYPGPFFESIAPLGLTRLAGFRFSKWSGPWCRCGVRSPSEPSPLLQRCPQRDRVSPLVALEHGLRVLPAVHLQPHPHEDQPKRHSPPPPGPRSLPVLPGSPTSGGASRHRQGGCSETAICVVLLCHVVPRHEMPGAIDQVLLNEQLADGFLLVPGHAARSRERRVRGDPLGVLRAPAVTAPAPPHYWEHGARGTSPRSVEGGRCRARPPHAASRVPQMTLVQRARPGGAGP